jgi:hypothetical protein
LIAGVVGGPRRDHLYRFRQCHDRTESGHAAGRLEARRGRPRAETRDDIQRPIATALVWIAPTAAIYET